MKYYNKETRSEDGKYYRKDDWSIEMPDGWDNGKNNYTAVAPPPEAFDNVPVDWDENLQQWIVDVEAKDAKIAKVSAIKLEDLVAVLLEKKIVDLNDFEG